MARKTKIVACSAENRDKGKNFLIVEMNPRKSEKWAARVLFAVARAGGADERDATDIAANGLAGLAVAGLQGLTKLRFEDAEPLLDEMFDCVSIAPDLSKTDPMTGRPITRPLIEDDIEELETILLLRSEVIELHTGFSPAAFLSTLGTAAKTTAKPSKPRATRTSRKRSA